MRTHWKDIPFLVEFYAWATISKGYSEPYALNCCLEAARFRDWVVNILGWDTQPGSITEEDCEQYLKLLMSRPAKGAKKPPKPNTIRSIRNRLHCVGKFLVHKGSISKSPWENVRGPAHEQIYIPPPSDEQINEALFVAGEIGNTDRIRKRNQAMVYFLAFTGVRTIELIRLNRDQLLRGGNIQRRFTVLGKGNKERRIGVTSEIVDPLLTYLESRKDLDPALFADVYGDRISHQAVRSVMREIKHSVNRRGVTKLDQFGAHSLRRWCFSSMVKRGVPTHTIRELGGWSTYTAMEHYTHYGAMDQAAEAHMNMRLLPQHQQTQQMRLTS